MPDISKWKVDRKQIRQPDPRDLGSKRIDGKPIERKLLSKLLEKQK